MNKMMGDNAILCYCTAVKKQLQTETLTQALKHLILFNEMLQVRLENGKYVPEPESHEEQRNKLLSTYDCAEKSSADLETLIEQIVENLSGEMSCKRGASIRAAVLNIDQGFNKLLLLSHRAIADQRGLVLLLEDLYRTYEQLSNGRQVALTPPRKTYKEFIKEVEVGRRTGVDDLGGLGLSGSNCGQEIIALRIMLDKRLKRRLFSWQLAEFGLTPVEPLAGALLKNLAKASQESSAGIHIKCDYRFADETLKHTVGALTRTHILPHDFAEKRELFSNIKRLKGILHDVPSNSPILNSPQRSNSVNTDLQLRLNLEYSTDYPWLGGDEWLPEGFIMTKKSRVAGSYAVEIIPFFSSDGIEILVEYKQTPELRAQVEKFAADLVPELETILCYCEEYASAKDFWIKEFAKAITQMKFEIEIDDCKVTDRGRASLTDKIEKSVIDRALPNVEADESQLLLAAYSVLISRLSGHEDLVLLCALDKGGGENLFPLRLAPIWTSSFKLFVEEVKGRLRQVAVLGKYALDILSEEQPKHGWPDLILEVGYVFRHRSTKKRVEQSAIYHSFNQAPDLVLEISQCNGGIDICFDYEQSRFSAETIKRFSVYLKTILKDIAADANIKIEDMEFERDPKVYGMAGNLIEDAFNF
jgi:hypothetical protein